MIASLFTPYFRTGTDFYANAAKELSEARMDMKVFRMQHAIERVFALTMRQMEIDRSKNVYVVKGQTFVVPAPVKNDTDPVNEIQNFMYPNRLKIKTTWAPSRGLDTTETYYNEES